MISTSSWLVLDKCFSHLSVQYIEEKIEKIRVHTYIPRITSLLTDFYANFAVVIITYMAGDGMP